MLSRTADSVIGKPFIGPVYAEYCDERLSPQVSQRIVSASLDDPYRGIPVYETVSVQKLRIVIKSQTMPSQYLIVANTKAPTIGIKDSPFSSRKVLVSVRPCLST